MAAERTLEGLIDGLGRSHVRSLVAPRGLDQTFVAAEIHDPGYDHAPGAGQLVLGVGWEVGEQHAVELVRAAGDAGAAAVLIKVGAGAVPTSLVETAAEVGVALLEVGHSLSWASLLAYVHAQLASPTELAADRVLDVPLANLYMIADELGRVLDCAVSIEDAQGRVLAYTSRDDEVDELWRETVLARRAPAPWRDRWRRAGVFDALSRTAAAVGVDGDLASATRPRVAVPVRMGGEPLGSIWIVRGIESLDEELLAVATNAAGIVAMHLVHVRFNADFGRDRRTGLLRLAFDPRSSKQLIAEYLCTLHDDRFAVLAIDVTLREAVGSNYERERIADLLATTLEAWGIRSLCGVLNSTVYGVLAARRGGRADQLPDLARSLAARLQETSGLRLDAGLSARVRTLAELPHARREADQVVRALPHDRLARDVADVDELRSLIFLLELDDLAHEHLSRPVPGLARLIEHDQLNGTAYAETLHELLRCSRDVARAAAALHVHQNTLRYRIRRLVEIGGFDLDDPDERLTLELQLRSALLGR